MSWCSRIPTDPTGEAANYIKRLIGLPNEQIWLADGDVFAEAAGGDAFRIQRKPEHVQRAVWQPVSNSDYIPLRPERLNEASRRDYQGPPWTGDKWDTSGRSYRCDTAEPTTLTWDNARRSLDDWAPYNLLVSARPRPVPVSDIRVSAGIEALQPGLKTTVELEARGHLFEFAIESIEPGKGQATLRMRPLHGGGAERTVGPIPIDLPPPGQVFDVEFWHADQSMQLFINGKRAMPPLEYDWTPVERLQNAIGNQSMDDADQLIRSQASQAQPAQLRWRFEGSPVTLHRVRVDRDLHYRYDTLRYPFSGDAFGTHPGESLQTSDGSQCDVENGKLGPNQFMMCGDNSQMSLDSRLWGRPHPLVAQQIDDTPFIVNRKLLLGKAWVVYFPAPFSITEGGVPFVPDFGRLRLSDSESARRWIVRRPQARAGLTQIARRP
jgi:hypothetical protein